LIYKFDYLINLNFDLVSDLFRVPPALTDVTVRIYRRILMNQRVNLHKIQTALTFNRNTSKESAPIGRGF